MITVIILRISKDPELHRMQMSVWRIDREEHMLAFVKIQNWHQSGILSAEYDGISAGDRQSWWKRCADLSDIFRIGTRWNDSASGAEKKEQEREQPEDVHNRMLLLSAAKGRSTGDRKSDFG